MKLTLSMLCGLFIAFVSGEVLTAILEFEDAVIAMTVIGGLIAVMSVGIGLEWEKGDSDGWF